MTPAGKRTVFIHDNHRKDSKAIANVSFCMNDVVPHLDQILPKEPPPRPITAASASVRVI